MGSNRVSNIVEYFVFKKNTKGDSCTALFGPTNSIWIIISHTLLDWVQKGHPVFCSEMIIGEKK